MKLANTQILIVEDEQFFAVSIQDALRRLGYGIAGVASSGEEAIKKAKEIMPNLVLMDIVLKGEMDGIEAAGEIRKCCDIPVIYLTGLTGDKLLERVELTEPFGYILKPFQERELHTIIEIALYKHKIEKKLEESEERFHAVAESAADAIICLKDPDNIYFWNKKAEEMFGYSASEAMGRTFHDLVVPAGQHREAYEGLKTFFRTGTGPVVGKVVEVYALRKDGTEFPVELSISAMNIRGKWQATGIVRDITERKKTEELIERAKKEWEATFDAIKDPIFMHDNEFKVTRANKAYQRMAGMEFKEFIGKPYYQVYPKMDGPFKRCLETIEAQREEEEEFISSVGKIFKARFYPVRDATGKYLYLAHIMEDITERKKAEEKIKTETEINSHLLMIAEATSHTTDVDKLMEQVVGCASKILDSDACLSYLWNREFIASHAVGLSNALMPQFRANALDQSIGFVNNALNKKQPVIEQLVESPFPYLPNIKTIAAIPLVGHKGYLGLIIAVYKKTKEFYQRDLRIMGGISGQVSTALEEARLYRESIDRAMELARRIEVIQTMHEIDKSILSTLEPQEILETSSRMVSRVVAADLVTVALVDKERGGFRYATGLGAQVLEKLGFVTFEQTSATEILRTGLPEYVPNLKDIPELLLTEKKLMENGFLSHIRMPITVKGEITGVLTVGAKRPSAFASDDLSTLEKLASQISVAMENARLISDLQGLFMATVESLSSAIDAKSPWTAGHSARVTKYAFDIAKEMGFSEKELKDLQLAGLLHDIGKIGIYEAILDKPGRLTDEELKIMRQHPVKGAEILAPIKQLKHIIPGIKYHHEYYDGKGYPDGLKGDAIPLVARILCVADTVDAMGEDRPYRKGKAMEAIVAELKRCSGAQFDPQVVQAFLKTL